MCNVFNILHACVVGWEIDPALALVKDRDRSL